jgi:hypothetical protein
MRTIVDSKKDKASTFTSIEINKPSSLIISKVDNKLIPSTSSLEIFKEPSQPNSSNVEPLYSLSINEAPSSSSTTQEVLVQTKINYFANLFSDSDDFDDEFVPYTILYPSSFIIDETLPNAISCAHLGTSTKILQVRIKELEGIVDHYKTKMDELERAKFELSKYKGENGFLKVKVQTLETENHTLKTNSDSSTIIILDLKLVYGCRKC